MNRCGLSYRSVSKNIPEMFSVDRAKVLDLRCSSLDSMINDAEEFRDVLNNMNYAVNIPLIIYSSSWIDTADLRLLSL